MNQYQNPYYMVQKRRPRAWINGTLIVINILYFVYLELAGSTEDAYFMLEHGAMYGPFVLEDHEYYRLFTSMFMHFGIDHIVNNMLVLFVLPALVLILLKLLLLLLERFCLGRS